MKSKKIISLVAMAAMLAACSQDELVSVTEDAKVDLGNRPTVGNVTLGLASTQTRMDLAEGSSLKLAWANGDKIGAAIVDLPAASVAGKTTRENWTYDEYLTGATKTKNGKDYTYEEDGLTAKDFYALHDYISSNYPYEYQDGSFNTQANLVEGNYVFYAPYNPANLMRKPIKVVLPMEQDCSDDVMKATKYKQKDAQVSSTVLDQFYKGTIKGFENAPVAIGYKFLEAPKDGSVIKPTVDMNQLYAFPMITVKNDFESRLYGEANDNTSEAVPAGGVTMTVDSIQIYHEDNSNNNIFYTALTKASSIATKLGGETPWDSERFKDNGAPTSDLLDDFETAYPLHNETKAIKMSAANTALSAKANRVTCLIGKELKNNEEYHFHAILPAGNYAKNLKARVFVTIGEKHYVIAKATINTANPNPTYATSAWDDFTFKDELNGGEDCVLIRGEHYPQAEFQRNGEGTKAFAGNMLTLNLGDGTAAFELSEVTVTPTTDNGLKTNTDLINYLRDNVQRGVSIQEYTALRGVEKDEWKTYAKNGVTAAAGNLAFSADNTIIINAALVKDLAEQIYVTNAETFTLATNLPAANDVKLTINGDVYTYTTLGENPVEFKFTMTGVTMGSNAEALVAGINKIGATNQSAALTKTLALAENASNAVVYLAGKSGATTTVTVENGGEGISAIYVNEETKLVVKGAACSALIVANGGEIELTNGGSLTNENNSYAAAVVITNNNGNVLAGTIAEGTTVQAAYNASWPTAAIKANSQINTVTINLSVANANYQIEQAQIDIFKNLTKGVALTLGGNIKGITSENNVVLTNLKSLTGTQNEGANIKWTTTSNEGRTVTYAKDVAIENIDAVGNMNFVESAE